MLAGKLVEGFSNPCELVVELTASSHVLAEAAAVHGRRALAVTPDGPTFRQVHRVL